MRRWRLAGCLVVACFVFTQCGGDVENAAPNGNVASAGTGGAGGCPEQASEAGCAGVDDGLEPYARLRGSCSRSTVVNRDGSTTACYRIR